MTKTTFAGLSPWANLVEPPPPTPKAKPKRQEPVIDALEIVRDRPKKPAKKQPCPGSKYDQWFEKLKPRHAIKCPTRHVHAVVTALRAWQRLHGLNWHISSTMDYGDGSGRVFRLK